MATQVTVNGSPVKVRHPLAPIGLSLITLGIYGMYWYYAINKELKTAGEKVNPGMSLLAITLGAFLLVPPFVSLYNTCERIQRVQARNGVTAQISSALGIIMLFIPIVNFFQAAYVQSNLNKAWERAGTAQ